MSRFFATGSDSESDSASEEEQVPRAPATAFTVSSAQAFLTNFCFSKFLLPCRYIIKITRNISLQFSDDEEETKRIVRSTKEKRYEEIANLIKLIRNYKKIKDMSSMLTSK